MATGSREGARAQGADCQEQGDEAVGAPRVQASAGYGGLVPTSDLGLPEGTRHRDLARAHLPDDQGGGERGTEEALPPQEAETPDEGDEHPGQGEHPREAGRGGREEVRGLGDGSYHREKAEERDTDPVREEQELSYNGKAAVCEESGESGRDGYQSLVALQEECPDDNHGQRV